MSGTAERTIGLGRRSPALGPICAALGIGEYRRAVKNRPGGLRPQAGWFLSQGELDLLLAELKRRKTAARERYRARKREQEQANKVARAERPRHERAIEAWRVECANPAPGRESPEACWVFICAAYGLPANSQMPREEPQHPMTRAELVEQYAARRFSDSDDRHETRSERDARWQRERGE